MSGHMHRCSPCSAVLVVIGTLVSARPYKGVELMRHKKWSWLHFQNSLQHNRPQEKGNPPVPGLNNRQKFHPKSTIITAKVTVINMIIFPYVVREFGLGLDLPQERTKTQSGNVENIPRPENFRTSQAKTIRVSFFLRRSMCRAFRLNLSRCTVRWTCSPNSWTPNWYR